VVFCVWLTQNQIVMECESFGFFAITCKFLIYVIIDINQTYISQMCNANNLSLIIGATRIYMFLKSTIDCKILWRSIKMVENTWNIISHWWNIFDLTKYCRVLFHIHLFWGLKIKPHQSLYWNKSFFFYCWDFDKVS
jgi:hypothetical protein